VLEDRMIRLLSVSDENRSITARWREGLTAEQFADAMWARREAEYPGTAQSTGEWPFVRLENQENNITPLRRASI
jgi:hypothetical protein